MGLSQSPSSVPSGGITSALSMGLAAAALAIGCSSGGVYRDHSLMDQYIPGTTQPSQPDQPSRPEGNYELSDLPKGAEDVYLLLFQNNPYDGRRDDDFIAEAAKVAGYSAPHYWHTEIAYFDHGSQHWKVMGCRPPSCSLDYPVSELVSEMRGNKVDIRHLRVPVQKQLELRSWFMSHLHGQSYNLAGPLSTNCADAVVELGKAGGFPEVLSISAKTREEMRTRPGMAEFLRRWNIDSINDVMKRDSIVFPDELRNIGRHIKTVRF